MGSPPIPATLPGLLRSGTGVLDRHGTRGVWVERIGEHGPGVAWETGELVAEDAADLTLDLDSPTSRAHLAWWILAQPGMHVYTAFSSPATLTEVLRCACGGRGLSPDDVALLTTVARHLAGLESE